MFSGTLGGDKGHSMARGELQRNSVFQRLMEDLSKKYDSGKQQSSTLNNSGKEQNSTLNNSGMFAQVGHKIKCFSLLSYCFNCSRLILLVFQNLHWPSMQHPLILNIDNQRAYF